MEDIAWLDLAVDGQRNSTSVWTGVIWSTIRSSVWQMLAFNFHKIHEFYSLTEQLFAAVRTSLTLQNLVSGILS
jgi:hypothetical protein